MTISQIRLEAPIILVGLTALSVEINTIRLTPERLASDATFIVPNTLFLIAPHGLYSINGTCLCAAAWNTKSGLYCSKISRIFLRFWTETINTITSNSGCFLPNSICNS